MWDERTDAGRDASTMRPGRKVDGPRSMVRGPWSKVGGPRSKVDGRGSVAADRGGRVSSRAAVAGDGRPPETSGDAKRTPEGFHVGSPRLDAKRPTGGGGSNVPRTPAGFHVRNRWRCAGESVVEGRRSMGKVANVEMLPIPIPFSSGELLAACPPPGGGMSPVRRQGGGRGKRSVVRSPWSVVKRTFHFANAVGGSLSVCYSFGAMISCNS